MIEKCIICDKVKKQNKTENNVEYAKRKYCSRECYYKSKRTGKTIKCEICNKSFYIWLKQIGKRKYCSPKCQGIGSRFKLNRNCILCNKVFKVRSDYKAKRFCSLKCWLSYRHIYKLNHGSNNARWKGDDVGYAGIHKWIYKALGRPLRCEHCGDTYKKRVLNWANKSHKYKRDTRDWMALCCSCHRKYDLS